MIKKLLSLQLALLGVLQLGITQSHHSHQIYDHVQEINGEFKLDAKSLFTDKRNLTAPTYADEYVRKAQYYQLDEAYAKEIKKSRPNTLFLDIPLEGQNLQVQLYKKEVTTSSYRAKTSSGILIEPSMSIFYRGIVKGKKKSFVSLSILNSSLHMTISNDSENHEINRIENDLYAIYRVSDSKRSQDTGCSSGDLHLNENVKIKNDDDSRSIGDCIEVYIECDFDSYQKNGSSIQNTEDWALAIMNEVGILYENEGIPMVVSDILVYDSPDPYLAGSSSGDMLDIMGGVVGDYDGRLAHVFSTRNVGGGIAWVDVLCAFNDGFFGPFAVSGSMNTNVVPFPVYSWNVNVVAHELGHNVGSLHTHDCVWNGNNTQIDDCGSEGGDTQPCWDSNNSILPSSGGTVMSYCHLIGGVGINFSNGFGSQPGTLLLNEYTNASCVTGEDCSGPSEGTPPVADFTFTQFNVCNPSEVQLTDLSTGDPTSYEWTMIGATPEFSTDQNPFVVYSEPGFYSVTLNVSNSDGMDELTLNQLIEVIEIPVADFDYEIIGDSIQFSNQTTGFVNSYFWDFGDGYSSTMENPIHSYDEDGNYIVELTINSACGEGSVDKEVNFFIPPTADFGVDTTFGCAPLEVSFINQSTDNTDSFLWTFEGGNPSSSTSDNPTVIYEEEGSYDVKLWVMNDTGVDSLVQTDYIIVDESPSVDFGYTTDMLEVSFENMSEGYDTLTWDFGDGNTSTMAAPTHTYDAEDIYDVTLTVMNICDTLTTTKTINLTSQPSADYTIDNSEGCLPHTVMFTDNSSTNVASWDWSFPGGSPSESTEENPTVVYNEAGEYNVQLIVTNLAGKDTVMNMNQISIIDVPVAGFSYVIDGNNVDFSDLSQGYESLSWDFGDGSMSVDENPQHTYDTEGIYEVTLSATNGCGTVSESQTITISSLPTAGYSASITEDCIPFSVDFSNGSSSNVTVWEWSFPGGTPSTSMEENPTVTYDMLGVYDVTLIVTSFAGKDTLTMEDFITPIDVPVANFDFTADSEFDYSFNNSSINADTYSWDFGDGNTSDAENPMHTYMEEGLYTVVLSATNECGTITFEDVIIVESTSVAGIDIVNKLSINPNPNLGDFILSIDAEDFGVVTLEIYNVLGQKVKAEKLTINSGENSSAISLENQPQGAYLLLIRKGGQSHMVKFLVN